MAQGSKLKKFELVNIPEKCTRLVTPFGDIKLEEITDDQAELLFKKKSRYVKEKGK